MRRDAAGRVAPMVGLALAATVAIASRATSQEVPAASPGGAAFSGRVVKASKDQGGLIASREHCSVDPDRLRAIGVRAGGQVRVTRDDGAIGLYTVEAREEPDESVVRMGLAGRARLGAGDAFAVRVVAAGPHPTLTDADARRLGEFVERSDDDGKSNGLLVLAPHGGAIERHTDDQAERVARALNASGKPVTAWRAEGYAPAGGTASASTRWHITSTDIDEASFPRLGAIAGRRFAHAVSFHGMAGPGILIGGGADPASKREVADEIRKALPPDFPVTVAGVGTGLSGSHPRNVVNRYCDGTGIQVEQSGPARRDHWRAVADAVARVYARKP